MIRNNLFLLLFFAFLLNCYVLQSQTYALKSNVAYWSTSTPNIGIEMKVGERGSVEFNGGFNPFEFSENRKFKHWLMQYEYRWWFCETFSKHFLGLHTHFAQFNVGGWDIPIGRLSQFKKNKYEGYLYGTGLSYGYQWVLNKRWNLELLIGAGYARIDFDEFCLDCPEANRSGFYDYWGVTRTGLSFVYFLK